MTPSKHDLPPLHLPRALQHLHARPLTLDDADVVLAMRREVLTAMPAALRAVDPSRGCLPEVEQAWALTHLGTRARTLGVFDGSTLVALACLLHADAADPADPGHALALPAAEWDRTAHMAVCLVAEDYRGMNLQSKLLNWRRDVALRHRRTLLVAMTACGNEFSRRNLLAAGLGIHWVGQWRAGTWWYGMVQDLAPAAPGVSDRDHEWVDQRRIDRQWALLAAGYVGVAEMTWHGNDSRREPHLQFVRRHASPLRPPAAAPAVLRRTEVVQ
jgi:hypothetical protein